MARIAGERNKKQKAKKQSFIDLFLAGLWVSTIPTSIWTEKKKDKWERQTEQGFSCFIKPAGKVTNRANNIQISKNALRFGKTRPGTNSISSPYYRHWPFFHTWHWACEIHVAGSEVQLQSEPWTKQAKYTIDTVASKTSFPDVRHYNWNQEITCTSGLVVVLRVQHACSIKIFS